MAKYTLYGCPNTASTGIRWILEELSAAGAGSYEFVNVSLPRKEQKEESYLAVNSKGRVPTLVVDGEAVTEAGAISLLLSETHSSLPLAGPQPGQPHRAKFLETHIFVVNSLLPALRDWFYADKDQTDKDYAHGIRLLTLTRLQGIYSFLDASLAKSKYLTNDTDPTVTDFLFAATLSWDGSIDKIAGKYPNLKRYTEEMRSRKTWKDIAKTENIDLSVNPWAEPYLSKL